MSEILRSTNIVCDLTVEIVDSSLIAKIVLPNGDVHSAPISVADLAKIVSSLSVAKTGAFADSTSVQLHPFINEKFVYGSAPNVDRIVTDTSGGGTVTIANGMIVVATGAAINKTAYFRTRRPIPYSAGFGSHLRCTFIFSSAGAGKYKESGVGTTAPAGLKPRNAICVVDNAGQVSLDIRKANSTILTVPRESWLDKLDGNGASGVNLTNFENGLPFEFMWPYLGFGDVQLFCILDSQRILVAIVHIAAALTTPFIENPTLYPYAFVENTSSNTNTSVSMGSIGGITEFDFSKSVGVNYDTPLTSRATITTEVPILSVFNPLDAFGGTGNNGIILKLVSYTASSDGTGSANCDFQFYLHSSAVTGGAYSDLLADRSVQKVNTSPTSFTTTNERRVHAHTLDRPASAAIDIASKDILLYPGEYLTVTGKSSTQFTGVVSLGFMEFQ